MKIRPIAGILFSVLTAIAASAQSYDPADYAVIRPSRPDGRFISSYAIAHRLVRNTQPKYAYRSGMSASEFSAWQDNVRNAMAALMQFPEAEPQPDPRCIRKEQRQGYTVEKWEFYPLPEAVSTFLVLTPDSISAPAPAVLCIPGSGHTKEMLADETGDLCPRLAKRPADKRNCMALQMVQEGYIAVVVDNPATGESSDLECLGLHSGYDYDTMSRLLLEIGWSWLGYTSFLDQQVLDWMKQHPQMRHDRIAISGFSLGTEPMMVLGVLNPDVHAFIYNDFLCHTQERAIVMTKPSADTGYRPFPNSIRHLIPDYWKYFNFPDVAASLAPRPIIFTEGGLDRDFRAVQSAYATSGQPSNMEYHHYPRFQNPSDRCDTEHLEEGMDAAAFFKAANVDPGSHYFKSELIIPWLRRVMR